MNDHGWIEQQTSIHMPHACYIRFFSLFQLGFGFCSLQSPLQLDSKHGHSVVNGKHHNTHRWNQQPKSACVCPLIYPSIYLSIYPAIYLSMYQIVSIYPCIFASMYVSMYLCVFVSICASMHLVSLYLRIYVSMYLCIYISMYLCIYTYVCIMCIYIYMYWSVYINMYIVSTLRLPDLYVACIICKNCGLDVSMLPLKN